MHDGLVKVDRYSLQVGYILTYPRALTDGRRFYHSPPSQSREISYDVLEYIWSINAFRIWAPYQAGQDQDAAVWYVDPPYQIAIHPLHQ